MVMATGGVVLDGEINDEKIIINEVLCTLQNYYKQLAKTDLVGLLCDFYNTEDMVTAKSILFTSVKGACIDNTPKLVTRKGDNKRRADTDDLVSLFALLDVKKIITPRFVASNLAKIPLLPLSLAPASSGTLDTRVADSSMAGRSTSSGSPSVDTLDIAVRNLQQQMQSSVLAKLDDIYQSPPSECSVHTRHVIRSSRQYERPTLHRSGTVTAAATAMSANPTCHLG